MKISHWLWRPILIYFCFLVQSRVECRRYDKCSTHGGRQGVCVVKRYCRGESSVGTLQSCDGGDTYCCPLPTAENPPLQAPNPRGDVDPPMQDDDGFRPSDDSPKEPYRPPADSGGNRKEPAKRPGEDDNHRPPAGANRPRDEVPRPGETRKIQHDNDDYRPPSSEKRQKHGDEERGAGDGRKTQYDDGDYRPPPSGKRQKPGEEERRAEDGRKIQYDDDDYRPTASANRPREKEQGRGSYPGETKKPSDDDDYRPPNRQNDEPARRPGGTRTQFPDDDDYRPPNRQNDEPARRPGGTRTQFPDDDDHRPKAREDEPARASRPGEARRPQQDDDYRPPEGGNRQRPRDDGARREPDVFREEPYSPPNGNRPKGSGARTKEPIVLGNAPRRPPDQTGHRHRPGEIVTEQHRKMYGEEEVPDTRPYWNEETDAGRANQNKLKPTNQTRGPPVDHSIKFPGTYEESLHRPKVPDCGVKPYDLFIAGGEASDDNEWPWMTAIFRRHQGSKPKTFLCGGSLINTRYVLTAAHCFVNNYVILPASSFVVRLGSHSLDSGEEYTVSHLAIHGNHSGSDFFNDIALVRLASEVYTSDKIAPVCLPAPGMMDQNLVGRMATVAGWGDTAFRTSGTRTLQHVVVPVVSSEECFGAYSRVKGAAFLAKGTNHVVCAGLREGGKDACLGDSGGPLMLKTDDDRWTVVGIVSLGYKCAEPGYPGVYTRVTHYMSWIQSKTKERHY